MIIPYQRLVTARTAQWRRRIAANLASIVQSTHEVLLVFDQLEHELHGQHDHLVQASRRHDEAYRLVLRCQEIATLSDPEEMARQRDTVVREWAALHRERGEQGPHSFSSLALR